jgi:hypothetical protein
MILAMSVQKSSFHKYRLLFVISLVTTVAFTGCDKKSDASDKKSDVKEITPAAARPAPRPTFAPKAPQPPIQQFIPRAPSLPGRI